MNSEDDITNYLKRKYKPLAIFLTGSKAEGTATEFSDWDIIMLTKNQSAYVGEAYKNYDLDVTLKKIDSLENFTLATRWSPYKSIKILYDNSGTLAKKIVKNTLASYHKGRPKLNKQELEARIKFDARRLKKIEVYRHIPGAFMHNLTIFHDETIGHWFELREQWIPNIPEALAYIEKHDKKFYKLLSILSSHQNTSQKLKAATAIYKHLYLKTGN